MKVTWSLRGFRLGNPFNELKPGCVMWLTSLLKTRAFYSFDHGLSSLSIPEAAGMWVEKDTRKTWVEVMEFARLTLWNAFWLICQSWFRYTTLLLAFLARNVLSQRINNVSGESLSKKVSQSLLSIFKRVSKRKMKKRSQQRTSNNFSIV